MAVANDRVEDADGDRLFVYDGWNVVLELDANAGNATVRKFTWGLDLSGTLGGAGGIGGLLAVQEVAGTYAGNSYWFLYDANGNVGQLVKAADQSLAAHYEYDPYGNLLATTGSYAAANPYRFSTAWHDSDLPGNVLLYYGYRYYSPRLGRWLSRDPIEESGGLNLYAAYFNDPANRYDTLGLISCPPAPPPKKTCSGANWGETITTTAAVTCTKWGICWVRMCSGLPFPLPCRKAVVKTVSTTYKCSRDMLNGGVYFWDAQ